LSLVNHLAQLIRNMVAIVWPSVEGRLRPAPAHGAPASGSASRATSLVVW
jgi:hypothetical protein